MKVAYVIGPYKADNLLKTQENIHNARVVASVLMRMGYAVICPHSNTAMLDGVVSEEHILPMYIEILKRCDLAIAIPGFKHSRGSNDEIQFCAKNKIPVYIWPNAAKTLEKEAKNG